MDDLIGSLPTKKFAAQMEAMLCENLPNHLREDGSLDRRKVAYDLGISTQAINHWFWKSKLPWRQMGALTKLEGSTLTLEMIYPFTFRN